MTIGPQTLSPSHPVLIIAEIGVNHDGQLSRALELVHAAKSAGANAVKLQVFRATTLVHGQGILAEYQKRTTSAESSPPESSADLLSRLELAEPDLARVLAEARSLGLLSIATPFSPSDIPTCQRLGLDALKIASPDLVNIPLLTAALTTRLPLLISTGASTTDEIDNTRRFLSIHGAAHCFMHCVSAYPTPDDQAHLCFIPDLIRRYGTLVGYSDHAESLMSGALAVAAGAVLLERHLTYDRKAQGPDHAASSNPAEFAQYVALAREATRLRGTGHKRLLPLEQDVRTVSRQSLVLTKDISPEESLTPAHLTTQRPGTGIPASAYAQVLTRHPTHPLKAGTLLTWDMLNAA